MVVVPQKDDLGRSSEAHMKKVFLDIETLPANENVWSEIEADIQEDIASKYKKVDTIKQKQEEAFRRTSLSGEFGRVLCIGMLLEDGQKLEEKVLGWDEKESRFSEDEPAILTAFWDELRGFDATRDLLVGHNILDFDLKFIYQRSVVNKIRPSVEISFRRYSDQPIFDTMHEWAKWGRQDVISLDKISLVLGLKSSKSEDISGDKVYDRFQEGSHQMIRDYCMADVRLTREVFKRLTFSA